VTASVTNLPPSQSEETVIEDFDALHRKTGDRLLE
jgi:hypothetical protein